MKNSRCAHFLLVQFHYKSVGLLEFDQKVQAKYVYLKLKSKLKSKLKLVLKQKLKLLLK